MTQKKKTPEMQESQQLSPDMNPPAREPMTGAQASYLKTLSEEAHEPSAFDAALTKAAASPAHKIETRVRPRTEANMSMQNQITCVAAVMLVLGCAELRAQQSSPPADAAQKKQGLDALR